MMLYNHKSFILPLKQPISVNAVYGGATVLPNTTPHGMQSSNGCCECRTEAVEHARTHGGCH